MCTLLLSTHSGSSWKTLARFFHTSRLFFISVPKIFHSTRFASARSAINGSNTNMSCQRLSSVKHLPTMYTIMPDTQQILKCFLGRTEGTLRRNTVIYNCDLQASRYRVKGSPNCPDNAKLPQVLFPPIVQIYRRHLR